MKPIRSTCSGSPWSCSTSSRLASTSTSSANGDGASRRGLDRRNGWWRERHRGTPGFGRLVISTRTAAGGRLGNSAAMLGLPLPAVAPSSSSSPSTTSTSRCWRSATRAPARSSRQRRFRSRPAGVAAHSQLAGDRGELLDHGLGEGAVGLAGQAGHEERRGNCSGWRVQDEPGGQRRFPGPRPSLHHPYPSSPRAELRPAWPAPPRGPAAPGAISPTCVLTGPPAPRPVLRTRT